MIQSGLFHHAMHQCDAIYTVCYGGFLQPLQVEIGIKRVAGTPTKGKFKEHEDHMLKCYYAASRYMIRRFLQSSNRDELSIQPPETHRGFLCRLHSKFLEFRSSWETSIHGPSRMVALFLKYTRSYLRCKLGVSNLDFWIIEHESCQWLPIWKMTEKSTYL